MIAVAVVIIIITRVEGQRPSRWTRKRSFATGESRHFEILFDVNEASVVSPGTLRTRF